MRELFDAAFSAVNLPFTVLLGLVLLYWISVIVGIFDLDVFEIELDAPEVDVDVDADVATDMDGPGLGGLGLAILRGLHVGVVPTMILVSTTALSAWALSIVINHHLHNDSIFFALLLDVPILVLSLVVTKIVTTPLKHLFLSLQKEERQERPLVGSLGTVRTELIDAHTGQIEVRIEDGAPLRLNAKSARGEEIPKGVEVRVVAYDHEDGRYTVETTG